MAANLPADWSRLINGYIGDRKRKGLLRELNAVGTSSSASQACATPGGIRILSFSTNDYLGLSSHPDVKRAAAEAASLYGSGPRASAIVAGHTTLHEHLERRLALLKHTEACLLFPTGFAANSATLAALASTGHVEIFSDALNHASLIDGCRLAARQGTRVHVFRHRDYAHLEQLLVASAEAVAQNGGNHACERGAEEVRASSIGHEYGPQPPEGVHRNTWHYMVVTDGVFSMDGDIADLQSLARLKRRYHFLLVVDDAHGSLVLGPHGGGTAEAAGESDSVDVQTGTLSKAFGSLGGFVACSHAMKSFLVNSARAFTYSTALPMPCVAASLAALDVASREQWRRAHLARLQKLVQTAIKQECNAPICPVIVGSASKAVAVSQMMWARGFHLPAIRQPTVPEGSSRLRIGLSAAHSVAQVQFMLENLKECLEVSEDDQRACRPKL